jgi:NAD(P)-dependent dehydrogenase (short-subunit alcohol dehydrogenase family)
MSDSSHTLGGKHAVVTGGSRGIGAAIAAALAAEGTTLTLMSRDRARLAAKASELSQRTRVSAAAVDVGSATSIAQAFARAQADNGPISILINNAGMAASAPFVRTDIELWTQMLQVNLTGAYLCCREAIPGMIEQGFGRVVNIASTAGLIGYAYVSAYCAAKHGLVGLTRALALEMAGYDITVNAVCPGFTDTDLVADAVAHIARTTGKSEMEARTALSGRNPQQRLIRPEEVASAVLWLCQSGSSAINGQAIAVAGGEVQ